MNIIELQDKLKNLNIDVTAQDICNIWGMDKAVFSRKKKAETEIKYKNIVQLEKHFNIELIEVDPLQSDIIADFYPDVFGSCGGGNFVLSETKEKIKVPVSCFNTSISRVKQYSVIRAYGNTMEPYIKEYDKLIIQHYEGEQLIDNKVYVFCYNDEIYVKRLVKNINQLIIISDNTDYDKIKLSGEELKNITIIGQIVGIMRDCR